MPSIFDPTPQEHIEAYSALLDQQTATHVWKPALDAPPAHVKVQFFLLRYKVSHNLRPDIQAIIPLESSGSLSLFNVMKMWGLETCVVIDSDRMRLGFSSDPNYLSAATVKILIDRYGCIKLIEPYVSASTLITRHTRQILVSLGLISQSYLILASNGVKNDFRDIHGVHLKAKAAVMKYTKVAYGWISDKSHKIYASCARVVVPASLAAWPYVVIGFFYILPIIRFLPLVLFAALLIATRTSNTMRSFLKLRAKDFEHGPSLWEDLAVFFTLASLVFVVSLLYGPKQWRQWVANLAEEEEDDEDDGSDEEE
ncbi:hypothetical protein MIND_01414300 [Mycena indigotica]|uniref:Uncharacterized protein n=1 Tax=Mycena indigotica TaxID=2126181 RepID=A0A8H6VP68_9AGAR|nr:uncharacterized protein MIND_01414300 [Mycena indigotica]KAF7288977.1 hypothetical protein MIND_01414300 [Mycena indigotica]